VFTGLVQGIGNLYSLDENTLKVTCLPPNANQILKDLEIGDSVAVNGVCLTAVELLPDGFTADASPETQQRSNLGMGGWGQGVSVNLETSLRVGSKIGGHFVTGHVDGVGQLQASVETATSWELTFTTANAQVGRYIVPKGSIAVNGVSLTVADCNDQGSWFKVAVIPHTYWATNLSQLQPGSVVNLEGDLLGKYVDKFLRFPKGAGATPSELGAPSEVGAGDDWGGMRAFPPGDEIITAEFLAEQGYC
jgi:riboflavin synthase